MIIGDPTIFAIESSITEAYEGSEVQALGYFLLHLKARRFGVRESDATLLGSAYAEIGERLSRRGRHVASFAFNADAGEIIDAIGEAVYDPEPKRNIFLGLAIDQFCEVIRKSNCQWHRGYDEAFDDNSGILHFDVGDDVRLIADKPPVNIQSWKHDPRTLVEVRLRAVDFYGVLERWLEAFQDEWRFARKTKQKGTGN